MGSSGDTARRLRTKVKLAPGLEVGPSRIDGLGCFTATHFARGRKIAEYVGEKISRREVTRRLRGRRRIHICGIDAWWSIDGSVGGNGTQFINHSCEPNCFIKVIYGHIVFFALRDLAPGEEILLDYEDSYHSDRKQCRCGAASCRRTINRQAG